jgi:hypothetical protein
MKSFAGDLKTCQLRLAGGNILGLGKSSKLSETPEMTHKRSSKTVAQVYSSTKQNMLRWWVGVFYPNHQVFCEGSLPAHFVLR